MIVPRSRPPTWWLREVGLTLAAVIGTVCLLSALGSVAFQLKPLVFRSGSMTPAIPTGALAVAREVPADTLVPGDVVSVTNSAGTRITHRVVDAGPGGGGTTLLVLKGDANDLPDAERYTVVRVDLVVVTVPGLGYVVAATTHPVAIFVGGAVVGMLIMYAFGRRGARSPGGPGKSDEPPPTAVDGGSRLPDADAASPSRLAAGALRRTIIAGLVVVTSGALVVIPPPLPAAAAFVDTAGAVSGTLRAHTVPAPVLNCQVLGLGNVTFTWNAVTDATGYDFVFAPAGGPPVTTTYLPTTTSTSRSGLLGSGTATVRTRRDFGSTTWISQPSNTRSYLIVTIVTTCT